MSTLFDQKTKPNARRVGLLIMAVLSLGGCVTSDYDDDYYGGSGSWGGGYGYGYPSTYDSGWWRQQRRLERDLARQREEIAREREAVNQRAAIINQQQELRRNAQRPTANGKPAATDEACNGRKSC